MSVYRLLSTMLLPRPRFVPWASGWPLIASRLALARLVPSRCFAAAGAPPPPGPSFKIPPDATKPPGSVSYGEGLRGGVRFRRSWWRVAALVLGLFFGLPIIAALISRLFRHSLEYFEAAELAKPSPAEVSLVIAKLAAFVSTPSNGLILNADELNVLVATFGEQLGLLSKATVQFDLEQDDEFVVIVTIPEEERMLVQPRYLNVRACLDLSSGVDGNPVLRVTNVALINPLLPNHLSSHSSMMRVLRGNLLRKATLPPLLEQVLAATRRWEVRCGTLWLNIPHPLSSEEEALRLARRVAPRYEAPDDRYVLVIGGPDHLE